MKVLYLSPTGELGGAENVLLGTMTAVRKALPEIKINLLALSFGPLVERAAQIGAEVTVLPMPAELAALGDSQLAAPRDGTKWMLAFLGRAAEGGWEAWKFLRRFRHKVRRIDPDLIHSNGIKTHALVSVAGGRVPVLWHVHDFLGSRKMARELLRLAARRMAGAIAVSEAVGNDLRTLWPNSLVRVIANAVDVQKFFPGPQDGGILDRLAGMSPRSSCLRVGLIATYARWKGQALFLEAAARVLKLDHARPVRFYIIGGPIYHTRGSQFELGELHAMARQLEMADHVGFIRFQPDVVPIYRALDVVVHASTAPEPFGLTIVEAMACGKPVIAAQAGGAAEIFESGKDALGVPPGESQLLADALVSLIDDAPLRHFLGEKARQTVCKRFNQDRIGPQVLRMYKQVCDGTPAAGFWGNASSSNPGAGFLAEHV